MKRHPEDRIYEVRQFIKELETVQNKYFNKLFKKLKLKKEAEEYLWDYVFNSEQDTKDSFEEYLEYLGLKYEDFKIN